MTLHVITASGSQEAGHTVMPNWHAMYASH